MTATLGFVLPALSLVSCSSEAAGPALSGPAAEGYQVASAAGCLSCHGKNGGGGVGPAWSGLAGSTVELADGSTAVADDAYLQRAITDPGADKTAGYTINMPINTLTPAEVDAVIAYIEAIR